MQHVIRDGMIRDIALAMKNHSLRAALILVYSGIDAMTHLGLPPGQDRATRRDFKSWVETYLPIVKAGELTADEIYSARNGLVHAYSAESESTRSGTVRMLGYMSGYSSRSKFDPAIDPTFVLVNIDTFVNEFAAACDTFIADVTADPGRAALPKSRLEQLLIVVPGSVPE